MLVIMELERWQLSPHYLRGLTRLCLINCPSQCTDDDGDRWWTMKWWWWWWHYPLPSPRVPVCSGKYDAMMVMEMIAVLTIICYQTDEKSIITGRQQIIIYVTPRIFSRESCERNILLFIIFKIFSFHFALGSFQKYGGVLSW